MGTDFDYDAWLHQPADNWLVLIVLICVYMLMRRKDGL